MTQSKAWFEEWFDTPYYHILYKDRDFREAGLFIDNLIVKLNMQAGQKVLDLACGKGRHSIYLNQKGMDVVGADLSKKNIELAKQYENDNLHFKVHDMRKSIVENRYDFILNLFTSFGYFESDEENLQTLASVFGGLKHGGQFVLDFLNTDKLIEKPSEEIIKEVEGIAFKIRKEFIDGIIHKSIQFSDGNKDYEFEENVMAISEEKFQEYFYNLGFEIIEKYGDYDLGAYNPDVSERLIFRVRKP